jgi:signal transduction histidine kinase
VSHNLRAPLMSVLGLINLVQIENKKTDETLHNYFGMMQHSIHKLDDTLKEILDYSRNARSELNIEPVDFKKLVEDSFERLKYMEGSELITKKITVEGSSKLCSDGYRLSVIINNLVSNAIKYRDPNKENNLIDIQGKITDATLEITFLDNGIGISEEFMPKIFDMFFRATEKSEGAGLGLYIVKETIEKLLGTITVESKLGNGTQFKIKIPNMKTPARLETNNRIKS